MPLRGLQPKPLANIAYIAKPLKKNPSGSGWMANNKYLTPEITNGLVDTQNNFENGKVNALEMLSLRQRQTLKLIAEGNLNKQIAKKLGLKIKTIEMHRDLLMKKLGIDSVAGLTRFALQHKLID